MNLQARPRIGPCIGLVAAFREPLDAAGHCLLPDLLRLAALAAARAETATLAPSACHTEHGPATPNGTAGAEPRVSYTLTVLADADEIGWGYRPNSAAGQSAEPNEARVW